MTEPINSAASTTNEQQGRNPAPASVPAEVTAPAPEPINPEIKAAAPPASPTPPVPVVRGFTAVTVAPNEFEIHLDGKSMKGRNLNPVECAAVLTWLNSLPKERV